MTRHALVAIAGAALLTTVAACRHEPPGPEKTYTETPDLEVVAALGAVVGNIAVSPEGRIFITFHPEGSPIVKVAEIFPGNVSRPYPDQAWQDRFQTPQGIKLDSRGRLWVLDHGKNGFGKPALYGFDIATGALIHEYDFSSAEGVGWGSYLNDLSIDAERDVIYVADTSSYRMKPGLVVYDVAHRRARRLLNGHKSIQAEKIDMSVEGQKIKLLFVPIRIAIDSIVLDLKNEWLYYGPLSGTRMYRARTAALLDESLSEEALGNTVEDYGPKPISDGITIDRDDNIYITDFTDRAITVLKPPNAVAADGRTTDPSARVQKLVRDRRLVWPDGLSFGPDRWVYVTDSQLNRVLFHSRSSIAKLGPHYIYRFRALAPGLPGR